jgi:branched-chain amino acid aminotransferase
VVDGTLVTPPLSAGCLAGITRALVLEWCLASGIEVQERELGLAEALRASEVFITSSTRDVHPVHLILDEQGQPAWQQPVGPVTSRVAALFIERAGAAWNP